MKNVTFLFLSLLLAGIAPRLRAETMVNGHPILSTMQELVDPNIAAVIVVDMQNDWVSTEGINKRKDKAAEPDPSKHKIREDYAEQVKNMQAFLAAARKQKIPIVYAEYVHVSKEGAMLIPDCELLGAARQNQTKVDWAKDGTWGVKTIDELAPAKGDFIVRKSRGNAFYKTYLEDYLRNGHRRSVIITGTMCGGCVMASAIGALETGFYPILVRDCIDQDKEAWRFLNGRFPTYNFGEIIKVWEGKGSDSKADAKADKSEKSEK